MAFQCLLAAEEQKAQCPTEVHHVMEPCWDEYVENLENWLDSRTENCVTSCVDCFTNTLAITGQFAQNVQKGGQQAGPQENDRRHRTCYYAGGLLVEEKLSSSCQLMSSQLSRLLVLEPKQLKCLKS